MRRLLPALALLLAFGGCAERWTRPGTTEAEADATNAACADQGMLAVPAQMSWQIVQSGGTERERRCWRGHEGREVCTWVERWRPPRWGWVDLAQPQREAWRRECMREKGFTFQGYRPLRLQ